MKKRTIASALVALLASVSIGLAGGQWMGFPIIGDPANTTCESYGNGGVCNTYSPQGPDMETGSETIPMDTGSLNGANPQTVRMPSSLFGFNSRVNRLIGGDFNTNLWQRGTTPVSSATPSTTVIGADRWAVYSSTNTVTVTKQTGASDTIPASGLYASMRVSRPSTTTTTAICTGQVLDKQAATALIGNNAVLSFWALAGAGLSAVASNQVTVTIAYYTQADSTTPLTVTDAFMKGTATGYTAVTTGAGFPSQASAISVASGAATVGISTTWTRYSVWGKIPTATAAGTAVTGAGVTICYTPASGTGGSTEWFELAGVQLQAMSSTVTTELPNGVTSPSGFERRSAQAEADYQLYYTQGPGAEVNGQVSGMPATCTASGNVNIGYQTSTPMRIAPTGATSTLTSGGYSIKTAAAATGVGTLTVGAANTYGVTLNSTAACTTTLPYVIIGTNTTGLILFSAEP